MSIDILRFNSRNSPNYELRIRILGNGVITLSHDDLSQYIDDNCKRLTFSRYRHSSATLNLKSTFKGMSNLKIIDFQPTVDLSATEDLTSLCEGCSSLLKIRIPHYSGRLPICCPSARRIFYGCKSLTEVINFDKIPAENLSDFTESLYDCNELPYWPFKSEHFRKLTIDHTFVNCHKLTSVEIKGIHLSDFNHSFVNCSNLHTVKLQFDDGYRYKHPFKKCFRLRELVLPDENYMNGPNGVKISYASLSKHLHPLCIIHGHRAIASQIAYVLRGFR